MSRKFELFGGLAELGKLRMGYENWAQKKQLSIRSDEQPQKISILASENLHLPQIFYTLVFWA